MTRLTLQTTFLLLFVLSVWTVGSISGCNDRQTKINGRCCDLCPPGKHLIKLLTFWKIRYYVLQLLLLCLFGLFLVITLCVYEKTEVFNWSFYVIESKNYHLILVLKVFTWRSFALSFIKLFVNPVKKAITQTNTTSLTAVRSASHANKVTLNTKADNIFNIVKKWFDLWFKFLSTSRLCREM